MSKATAINKKIETDNEEEVLTLNDMHDKLSEIEAIMIFLANSIEHLRDLTAYEEKCNFGIHVVFHDLIDKTELLLKKIEKSAQKKQKVF